MCGIVVLCMCIVLCCTVSYGIVLDGLALYCIVLMFCVITYMSCNGSGLHV